MKRDMDLIRQILLHVEADPTANGKNVIACDAADFHGRSQDELDYHVELLLEAGFLRRSHDTMDASSPAFSALSWSGHEFLAEIHDNVIWRRVKERAAGLSGVAVDAIWEIAKAEVRKKLGLS